MKYYDVMFLADLAAFASLPALLLFVILYGFRSNWRANDIGRSLMHAVASLTGVLLLAVSTRLLTPFIGAQWEARPWLRLVLYLIVAAASWRLLWVLFRIQREDRQ